MHDKPRAGPLVLAVCAALTGCASVEEPPEVTFYEHRYYFAPQLTRPTPSDLSATTADSSVDATFKESGNTLSITTYSTDRRVDTMAGQRFFDSHIGASDRITLHLWIAASCGKAHEWSIRPGEVRINDVTDGKHNTVPLYSFLQYRPGLMRPGNSGVEAEVAALDRSSSIRCGENHIAAASATFAIDASARRLVVSLRNVVSDDQEAPVAVPDVNLTLTADTEVQGRANPLELLVRFLGGFAH